MRIEEYRGIPFLYREKEISSLIEWFNEPPQRILFVYGPKSRGKLISSYNSFLEALIIPKDEKNKSTELSASLSLGIIMLSAKRVKEIKEKKINLFDVLLEKIEEEKKVGKIPIMIIDEIQKLRDVYIQNGNGERELLKEFLNFCIRLTKEKHLSHVAILTSNTVFIERIYNDAKMKKTSDFMKISHLTKNEVYEWLSEGEKIKDKDIELIWEYLGGCITDIFKVINKLKHNNINLQKLLERERWLAYTEIDEYMASFNEDEEDFLIEVARKIITDGYHSIEGLKENKRKILHKWAEKEILFYDPLELKVMGNSRIYEKGMQLLIERHKKNK